MRAQAIIEEIETRRAFEPVYFHDLTGGRLRLMDLGQPEVRDFAYSECEACHVLVKGAHTCGAVKSARKRRAARKPKRAPAVLPFVAGGAA